VPVVLPVVEEDPPSMAIRGWARSPHQEDGPPAPGTDQSDRHPVAMPRDVLERPVGGELTGGATPESTAATILRVLPRLGAMSDLGPIGLRRHRLRGRRGRGTHPGRRSRRSVTRASTAEPDQHREADRQPTDDDHDRPCRRRERGREQRAQTVNHGLHPLPRIGRPGAPRRRRSAPARRRPARARAGTVRPAPRGRRSCRRS
jgi:hypothetical protein